MIEVRSSVPSGKLRQSLGSEEIHPKYTLQSHTNIKRMISSNVLRRRHRDSAVLSCFILRQVRHAYWGMWGEVSGRFAEGIGR